MENLAVITFQNIQDATGGLNKLKELDEHNEIVLYNILLVRKTGEKHYELLYSNGVDLPTLPPYEEMVDLLSNTIDEPIKLALAILSGLLVGTGKQNGSKNISTEYYGQFKRELQLNAFTILLDAEADDEFIISRHLMPYHGITFCTDIVDLYHKYIQEQLEQIRKEIELEKETIGHAKEVHRTESIASIEIAKGKREKRIDELKGRVANIKDQLDDRNKKIYERIDSVQGNINEKLNLQVKRMENRIKLFEDHLTRVFL